MKVQCVAVKLTDEQMVTFGLHDNDFSCYFEIGETYTVLGLTWILEPKPALFLQMGYASGILVQVPLCLFKIVDDRPSQFWRIKQFDNNEATFWPEEFYHDFFHDRLSDQEPEVWEVYEKILDKLEHEFDE